MGSGSGQQSQVLLNNGGIILPMSHLNFDHAVIHPTQCNVVPCAAEVDWIMEESGNAEKPEKQFRNFPPLSPSLTALQGTHFLKQKREEMYNEEKPVHYRKEW